MYVDVQRVKGSRKSLAVRMNCEKLLDLFAPLCFLVYDPRFAY